MIRLCEAFIGPQGEGLRMGRPSLFLRLAGCNLNCKWCDTPQLDNVTAKVEPNRVATWLAEQDPTLLRADHDLVITGGEPLLQHNQLDTLLRQPWLQYVHTTVETNCTIRWKTGWVSLWSLSPKFGSSGHDPDVEVLDWYLCTYGGALEGDAVQIKFVISASDTAQDIECAVALLNALPPHTRERLQSWAGVPVILQPDGGIFRRHGAASYLMWLRNLSKRAEELTSEIPSIRVLPQLHVLMGVQ